MSRFRRVATLEEKNDIIEYLNNKNFPPNLTREQKKTFRKKISAFHILNGLLCFKNSDGTYKRAVFSFETSIIQMILDEEHLPVHLGINRLVDIVHKKYYGIPTSLITSYVNNCETCARFNSLTTVEDIIVNEITCKFDRFMMDCVDLRRYASHNDGYSWVLNVMDTYTKYMWSFKMLNKSALQVKECLEYIYMNFGVPNSIQADNGKEFRNRLLTEFHRDLRIRVIHGRPRHPRSQGQIERANQTIKKWLGKALNGQAEKRWIDYLDITVYKYNITVHRATNQSPFMLFHGQPGFNGLVDDLETRETEEDENEIIYNEWVFESNVPLNTDNELHERVMRHFTTYRQTVISNSNPNTVVRRLEVGDRVLVKLDFDNNTDRRHNALDAFFSEEIYVVNEILRNNMIKIKDEASGEILVVFKNRLKKISSLSQ